ncbi:M20 family metallopeptidase [Candidatus Borrarchaeum sp.]|uniref:M20 family metallopeptidase n=1 Tax=Candidatus Borrarchaeum sp. TaxID=2846742 RepID=UPI00257AC8C5|nr:M20/M25/M40 family metallo-hydrolase [Candidatus Borrarchaeum sp.]
MQNNRIFKILQELVKIPSQYGNEQKISSWIFDFLADLGYEPYKVEVPDSGPDVIAEFHVDSNKPWILLNSHSDTVEEMRGWTRDPYGEIVGEKFYGIGACDMKSGLAVQLGIMEGLLKGEFKPNLNVLFTAVTDEELWSRGTITLIDKNIISPDKVAYAIVGEPHYLGNFLVGRRGRLILDIVVHGKAAHGATPKRGVNAINEVARIVQSLEALDVGWFPQFNIEGSQCFLAINGGVNSLSVPETVKLVLDRHYLPIETSEMVLDAVLDIIHNTELDPETKVEVSIHPRPTRQPLPFYTPLDNPLVQITAEEVKLQTDIEPRFLLGRTVADSNFVGMLGIPTIDLGPSGKKSHSADEWCDIPSLEKIYKVYKGVLSKLH